MEYSIDQCVENRGFDVEDPDAEKKKNSSIHQSMNREPF